ncbi:DUF397 domain-containing protein [Actinomadura violacea]|uniref:DUF397 domain-containing protein n=1 Tax=Actinomadura violacea TaxID=2819934 RepID=A0ABS3RIZ4_9ACTN|nr:DUF397 domain-containing protein [Actinomadura violacea]MBO2456617.1 DUF397 domain-containing protein [Actinomadura violacea]
MDVIAWRKARRSDDQGGACVEVARFPEAVGVRDSKNPDGPKLLLTRDAFRTILDELKH